MVDEDLVFLLLVFGGMVLIAIVFCWVIFKLSKIHNNEEKKVRKEGI